MKKTDKDEIIVNSSALFRMKGLRGTSMADIASASGLIKGSIYHHFPSKDALFLEVLDRANRVFLEEAFSLAYEDACPARERMQAMMDYLTRYFRENRICLMAHMSLEDIDHLPAARDKIQLFFKRWRDAVTYILKERHDKAQAREMAADIVSRVEGAAIFYHVFDDESALVRACEAAVALTGEG